MAVWSSFEGANRYMAFSALALQAAVPMPYVADAWADIAPRVQEPQSILDIELLYAELRLWAANNIKGVVL